jgi:hypothetical protein
MLVIEVVVNEKPCFKGCGNGSIVHELVLEVKEF